jgi:antitoxin component YwqK of YwqJK toxin-antitoxin module
MKPVLEPYVLNHKDGSLWATGQHENGVATGYWAWFRKDGTRLRSGYFSNGEQTGEWTTYDKLGQVYKVTVMKPKPPSRVDSKD